MSELISRNFRIRTHLAEELVIQILLKLPTRSLLRFRTVLKAWRALIDSPFFSNLHLNLINSNPSDKDRRCLIHRFWSSSDRPGIGSTTFLMGPANVMRIEGAPCLNGPHQLGLHGCIKNHSHRSQSSADERFRSSIQGPVNGVYCVKMRGHDSGRCTLLLWSPGVRQVRVLPPVSPPTLPNSIKEYDFDDQNLICGFGFDPSSNDYRIILITVYGDEFFDRYFHYCFHLYSLGTNTWKQLNPLETVEHKSYLEEDEDGTIAFTETISRSFIASADAIYRKGACYWYLDYKKSLFSFDFNDGIFKITSIPTEIPPGARNNGWIIANVDGCLGMVLPLQYADDKTRAISTSRTFDVYVMQENGSEKWWVKVRRIAMDSSLPGRFLGIVGDEFFVQEDGEYFRKGGKVVSYSLGARKRETEWFEYQHSFHKVPLKRVLPYRESLVSVTI